MNVLPLHTPLDGFLHTPQGVPTTQSVEERTRFRELYVHTLMRERERERERVEVRTSVEERTCFTEFNVQTLLRDLEGRQKENGRD